MNDKDYNFHKKRIQLLIHTYHRELGFNWFHIDHTYNREVDADEGRQVARTTVSWQYLSAQVEWNLPLVADQTDDDLRNIFFHEYAHILTGGLMQHVDTDNEAVCHIVEYTAEIIARTMGYAVDFQPKTVKNVKKAKKTAKTS